MTRFFPFAAAAVLLCGLTGCLQIPRGLVSDDALSPAANGKKGVVTFSVEQIIDGPFISLDGIASRKTLVRQIGEQLMKSGAFQRADHQPFARRGAHHIHFTVHYSTAVRREPAMILAFFGIPFRISSYLDMTAAAFDRDKAVYSPAVSEAMDNYVWLVFLPAAAVWNSWWAWSTQEEKCIRVLIRRIQNKRIFQ